MKYNDSRHFSSSWDGGFKNPENSLAVSNFIFREFFLYFGLAGLQCRHAFNGYF